MTGPAGTTGLLWRRRLGSSWKVRAVVLVTGFALGKVQHRKNEGTMPYLFCLEPARLGYVGNSMTAVLCLPLDILRYCAHHRPVPLTQTCPAL